MGNVFSKKNQIKDDESIYETDEGEEFVDLKPEVEYTHTFPGIL